MNQVKSVAVVGVGFVGLTLSLQLARRDIQVFAIDSNRELVNELRMGRTKVEEPDILSFLENALSADKLIPINTLELENYRNELENVSYFIFTPGTPIDENGIKLDALKACLEQMREFIFPGDLVVIRSTVGLGTCDDVIKPTLDSWAEGILLAMCPERTIEGDALNELETHFQVIGTNDEASFTAADALFSSANMKTLRLSSLKAAELLKLANNTYRDLMFAFANELTVLSQKAQLSSTEIINAANLEYPRSNIAYPGPSGGPCLEKDPWILYESGKKYGIEMNLSKFSREVNESCVFDFVNTVIAGVDKEVNHRILLVGIAFKGKPITKDTRGSFARKIARDLHFQLPSSEVFGYEKYGVDSLHGFEIDRLFDFRDFEGQTFGIFIVLNQLVEPSQILKAIEASSLYQKVLVIDLWNQFPHLSSNKEVVYVAWGGQSTINRISNKPK